MSTTYQEVLNPTLNALAKSSRRIYKLTAICQLNRQDLTHGGYRPLNVYAGTVSPTAGHPWTTGPAPIEPAVGTESGNILTLENGLVMEIE